MADGRRGIPAGRVRLADDEPAGLEVGRRGRREGRPVVGSVDEMAREEHRPERATQPDGPRVGDHALYAGRERGDHARPIVDPDHRVPEGRQRAGDPAGTAAEVEDRRPGPDRHVDQLGLPGCGQAPVEGDRAPVGRDVIRRGWPARLRAAVHLGVPVRRPSAAARTGRRRAS